MLYSAEIYPSSSRLYPTKAIIIDGVGVWFERSMDRPGDIEGGFVSARLDLI
jgi:hypothetical protein